MSKTTRRPGFDEQAFVEDWASGFYTQRQLADRYGLSESLVAKVVQGKRRADLKARVEAARRAARRRAERGLSDLVDRAVDVVGALLDDEEPRIALGAAREVLNRVVGRCSSELEMKAEDEKAAQTKVRVLQASWFDRVSPGTLQMLKAYGYREAVPGEEEDEDDADGQGCDDADRQGYDEQDGRDADDEDAGGPAGGYSDEEGADAARRRREAQGAW